MLEIYISFNLFIKGCMFICNQKTSKHVPLQNVIVVEHAHGLEEACLLVWVSRPYHSPPLALHTNLNPNGLPYLMPNPPT